MQYCVIYFSEVGLKKANRGFFENILLENIRGKLSGDIRADKEFGYIILSSDKNLDWSKLRYIPGITNYHLISYKIEKDIEQLKAAVKEFAALREFSSFRIETARHDKSFWLTSVELNALLGDLIKTEFKRKVKLSSPDLTIYIKVGREHIYIGGDRYEGQGGLPVGSTGRALCLLSGGIDSPVASYLAMKRGLKLRFIHFQPKNAQSNGGAEKIKSLVKTLSKFQAKTELITVDFSRLQDELLMTIPADFLMLIYRRLMIRIAEQYDKYLVMGDNLGQVASQTLENLDSVYSAAKGLILSPLLGFNKQEIIKIAREIGTYEISIRKYPDCCTYFVPRHPELRATPEALDVVESSVDTAKLVKLGVERARVVKI